MFRLNGNETPIRTGEPPLLGAHGQVLLKALQSGKLVNKGLGDSLAFPCTKAKDRAYFQATCPQQPRIDKPLGLLFGFLLGLIIVIGHAFGVRGGYNGQGKVDVRVPVKDLLHKGWVLGVGGRQMG